MVTGGKRVLLGKIAATHGIKGQLRIATYSGESDAVRSVSSVILVGPKGEQETFRVAGTSGHGRKLLLSLKGFDSINQVQHLVGRELYVERSQLPPLEEGEFYWCDLLGLAVRTEAGDPLGTLDDIIATGSNDVYVVRDGARELLIPALADVVLQVDSADGTMTVRLPEGLTDL